MNLAASLSGNFGVLSQCSSCCSLQFQPFVVTKSLNFGQTGTYRRNKNLKLERVFRKRETFVRATETQTEPEGDNDEKNGEEDTKTSADDPSTQIPTELNSQSTVVNEVSGNEEENKVQFSSQDGDNVELSSGSPLPGVKSLQLDESMRLSKETIEILRGQVFGFDTFFVTPSLKGFAVQRKCHCDSSFPSTQPKVNPQRRGNCMVCRWGNSCAE